jgi:hypothetical protein
LLSKLNSNLDNKLNASDIQVKTYNIPSATYTSGKGAIQIPSFTAVPSGYKIAGSYVDNGQPATMLTDLKGISGSNAYISYYASANVTTAITITLILIKSA